MSVEPGAAAPPRDEDDFAAAGLEAFFAAADFEDFFAPDATRLAAAFTALVDFFDLLFAIICIHLTLIVPVSRPHCDVSQPRGAASRFKPSVLSREPVSVPQPGQYGQSYPRIIFAP